MFGAPNTGLHKYRIFNIAIIDLVFTIVLAYIIHKYNPKYKFIHILSILVITGIFLHKLFCVRTTVDKLLFDST